MKHDIYMFVYCGQVEDVCVATDIKIKKIKHLDMCRITYFVDGEIRVVVDHG